MYLIVLNLLGSTACGIENYQVPHTVADCPADFAVPRNAQPDAVHAGLMVENFKSTTLLELDWTTRWDDPLAYLYSADGDDRLPLLSGSEEGRPVVDGSFLLSSGALGPHTLFVLQDDDVLCSTDIEIEPMDRQDPMLNMGPGTELKTKPRKDTFGVLHLGIFIPEVTGSPELLALAENEGASLEVWAMPADSDGLDTGLDGVPVLSLRMHDDGLAVAEMGQPYDVDALNTIRIDFSPDSTSLSVLGMEPTESYETALLESMVGDSDAALRVVSDEGGVQFAWALWTPRGEDIDDLSAAQCPDDFDDTGGAWCVDARELPDNPNLDEPGDAESTTFGGIQLVSGSVRLEDPE